MDLGLKNWENVQLGGGKHELGTIKSIEYIAKQTIDGCLPGKNSQSVGKLLDYICTACMQSTAAGIKWRRIYDARRPWRFLSVKEHPVRNSKTFISRDGDSLFLSLSFRSYLLLPFDSQHLNASFSFSSPHFAFKKSSSTDGREWETIHWQSIVANWF